VTWGIWYVPTREWVREANHPFVDPDSLPPLLKFASQTEADKHIEATIAPELLAQYVAREIR
jgi:hypothetical protein